MPNNEWIGCSSCGSVWLGHIAQARQEPCPYCGDATTGNITTVEGPSKEDVRIMEEMCDAFGSEIVLHPPPAGDAPTASETVKMGLSEALEHLGNLVDIAAPEDTHYPQAIDALAAFVEDAIKARAVLTELLDCMGGLYDGGSDWGRYHGAIDDAQQVLERS